MKRYLVPLLLILTARATAQDARSWKYHKEIRIVTTPAGAHIKGDVRNYPLAVKLNARNFDFTTAKGNGAVSPNPATPFSRTASSGGIPFTAKPWYG